MASLSEIMNNLRYGGLYRKLDGPQIQGYQTNENGDVIKTDIAPENTLGLTSRLADFILGKQEEKPDTTSTPQVGKGGGVTINSTVYNNPRTGGVLRDIAEGYKENRFNPISIENLMPNKNKNWANRLGEGIGSLTRFGVSPLARGLATAGAVGLSGGDLSDVLAFGINAAATNQKLKTQDKIYRDDLVQSQQSALKNNPDFNKLSDAEKAQVLENVQSDNDNYANLSVDEQNALLEQAQNKYLTNRQNEQLQNIADNVNNRRGYITQDVYKNLIDTQQLRDNADWRKMYFDTQQRNLEQQRDWQRQQYQMQQDEKRADRAFQYAELGERRRQNDMGNALGWAKLSSDIQNSKNDESYGDIEQQLNNFKESFSKVNNPYRYRIAGGASEFLNTLTPDEANFNSQRTLLFNQIARKLGGEKGVLSDQDIKRIDAALPKLSDTKEQKEAKMKAVYALLDIKKGSTKNDPLGIL